MAETTEAAAPAPEAPAAEPKPEIVVPEGTAPNAEEVGKAAVAEQEAARVADVPADVPAQPEVMAQAEPEDEPEYIEPMMGAKEAEKGAEVLRILAEKGADATEAELMKALEADGFEAMPTVLSDDGWICEERRKDVPGSDPRCTP